MHLGTEITGGMPDGTTAVIGVGTMAARRAGAGIGEFIYCILGVTAIIESETRRKLYSKGTLHFCGSFFYAGNRSPASSSLSISTILFCENACVLVKIRLSPSSPRQRESDNPRRAYFIANLKQ